MLRELAKQMLKVTVAVMIAAALQIGANILAYQERGYEAMGGEMLVFPIVVLIEYMAFFRKYDLAEPEESRNEEGCDDE